MAITTRTLLLLSAMGITLIAQASAASAETGAQGCREVVDYMKKEWKVIDFSTPSKPTAMRVEGKFGHENTAAQIQYMSDQINKADVDCRAGNPQSALQRVASVHDLLDAHGISQETANAAMEQK